MHVFKILGTIVCLGMASTTYAQPTSEVTEAFMSVKAVTPVSIVVPTVVELPLETGTNGRNEYAVYESASKQFIPYYIRESFTKTPATMSAYSGEPNDFALVDGQGETSVDYFLAEERESTAVITLTSSEPVESTSIILELDRYVALPLRVSITASQPGIAEHMIVAPKSLSSNTITFPATTANKWTVTLTYAQPLRINELRLVQDKVESTMTRSIRFLAQPQASYTVYHDPDRAVSVSTIERGNLADDRNVKVLPRVQSTLNQVYVVSDIDGDGTVDLSDNCVQVANADQADIDQNGRGDACDDFDRDGVIQSSDNCPNHTNRSQDDIDADGIGDVCDGEESRFTEKYVWIPWVGMGVAVLVLAILFMLVASTPKKHETPMV